MKKTKNKKPQSDYFDENEKRLIKTMVESGIGRGGRRRLAVKLFGKGKKGWEEYLKIEKELKV